MPAPPPLCLAYHAVDRVRLRHDPYRLFTDPAALRRHIATLRRWGYDFTTFAGLARRVAAGTADGHVALTFDDGFADNHSVLLPLLEETGTTATVFVVSGRLGMPNHAVPWRRSLLAEEVRALHDEGVEIGAHTVDHADLSTLDYDASLAQWTQCKADLEAIVEAPVTTAAYPYGRVNDDAVRACRDAGFEAACRTGAEGSWDDPWNLPRQDMINRASRIGLRLKRDDRFELLVRTLPGRAVRGVYHRVQMRVR